MIAVGFTLSCFGLLLFLWLAFGGPVPLGSKDYRVTVPFEEATQLAAESDVRISGVSVGKVKAIELSETGNKAEAELEIESEFAPLPANTRAILRQKTLLGETYVELTPGSDDSGTIPEDGNLPEAQVSQAVQLDEIFRAFDEPTRVAFQTWMADASVAFRGRGADLNAALGNLNPFASRADELLQILDRQDNAVQQLIRDGGETFDALSERPGQLSGLITNAEQVFTTTANRDQQIREFFQVLPTFLAESKTTLERLDQFSGDTNPLITQLRPSAKELSATLQQLQVLAPFMETFFDGLVPVNNKAKNGFGALREVLRDDLPAPLARVDSYFNELIPIVQAIRAYRRETTAFLGNVSAAANGFNVPAEGGGNAFNYVRSTSPLGPEVLASFPGRLKTERTNAYVAPGGYTKLNQQLDSFLTAHCTSGITATLRPGDAAALPNDLFDRVQEYVFGDVGRLSTDQAEAPACVDQPPIAAIGGASPESSDYPKVKAQP